MSILTSNPTFHDTMSIPSVKSHREVGHNTLTHIHTCMWSFKNNGILTAFISHIILLLFTYYAQHTPTFNTPSFHSNRNTFIFSLNQNPNSIQNSKKENNKNVNFLPYFTYLFSLIFFSYGQK